MPIERADAHIHLFAGGYRAAFTARPGVTIDEAVCYASLAADHNIGAALVIGYGVEPWCANNNDYLATMAALHAWVRPLAFVHENQPLDVGMLEHFAARRFIGLSFYIFSDADSGALSRISDEVWTWLVERRWLISINSRGAYFRAWLPILQRHEDLRLLISHLGLPARTRAAIGIDAARATLADVLALACFPSTHVKLSGFYALSNPGYDYPHPAAWPYVEVLLRQFTSRRLIWGSDFSPCLGFLSFPQTLGLFDLMPFLTDADRADITGRNLLGLVNSIA